MPAGRVADPGEADTAADFVRLTHDAADGADLDGELPKLLTQRGAAKRLLATGRGELRDVLDKRPLAVEGLLLACLVECFTQRGDPPIASLGLAAKEKHATVEVVCDLNVAVIVRRVELILQRG